MWERVYRTMAYISCLSLPDSALRYGPRASPHQSNAQLQCLELSQITLAAATTTHGVAMIQALVKSLRVVRSSLLFDQLLALCFWPIANDETTHLRAARKP
jgi:hypothetical protein